MKSIVALVVVLLGFFVPSHGQSNNNKRFYVKLSGVITELNIMDSSEVEISGVPIEIWAGDDIIASIQTDEKGRYSYNLPYYNTYTIKYGGGPLVCKMIEIDASDFAVETQKRGFEMEIDIALFRDKGYRGLEFMKETPVAKATYSKKQKTVVWDVQHTESMNEKMRSAMLGYH